MTTDFANVQIVAHDDGVVLEVKVVPGASRTRIAGVLGSALKVAVSAPPEGGKANVVVAKLLAEVFDVAPRDVTIVSGMTQPRKRIQIAGLVVDQARERLTALATE